VKESGSLGERKDGFGFNRVQGKGDSQGREENCLSFGIRKRCLKSSGVLGLGEDHQTRARFRWTPKVSQVYSVLQATKKTGDKLGKKKNIPSKYKKKRKGYRDWLMEKSKTHLSKEKHSRKKPGGRGERNEASTKGTRSRERGGKQVKRGDRH